MESERVRPRGTRAREQVGRLGRELVLAALGLTALGLALVLVVPSPTPPLAGSVLPSFQGLTAAERTPDAVDPNKTTLSLEEVKAIYAAQAEQPRFDGTLLGWRVGPYEELEADGLLATSVTRSCESREAGPETPTQLDFTVGYLPSSIKVGQVTGPVKWVCGGDGISVLYHYSVGTAIGVGEIWIQRVIRSRAIIEMDVPEDSVETSTINGKPAIVVHPAHDMSGLGMGRVVVIEDDMGPEFTILSVTTDDGIPFDELLKIAEGIK